MNNESSFESTMKELEEKVANLERGNLTLEEALTNFEEGIKLSKIANQKLEAAEKRINILLTDKNGNDKEEEFEAED